MRSKPLKGLNVSAVHKAARIFADEGLGGLVRRFARKAFGKKPPPTRTTKPSDTRSALDEQITAAKLGYEAQVRAFGNRCRALGYEVPEHYYWYHAVDLGDDLITPGDYDFRLQPNAFGFPDDMTGMRVLDVGAATGYFTFEFERRGAEVTSVELPSLFDWDVLTVEREQIVSDLVAYHRADSAEQAWERHLDGPYRFCHERLRSKAKRCYSSVYDLTLAKLGGEKFDLVYAGDVLMHLFSPFKALDVLSGLTRGALVVTIETPFPVAPEQPLIMFRGFVNGKEGRTWWMPSRGCVDHMLQRVGFNSVRVSGRYSGIARRAWFPYWREVITATRA